MPNTVITLIGPSHSGKSTKAVEIKNYLESIGKTCQIISSDNYRRELLHLPVNAPIPTSEGFAISEVAFKKLKADLDFYMSHPCNTDVVIIDTTGLDKSFREDIARIAKINHMQILQLYSNYRKILFLNVYMVKLMKFLIKSFILKNN